MKHTFIFFLFINILSSGYCQDFKYINPKLTDSTKVVKIEIDTTALFERIYFIDFSKNSKAKRELVNFGNNNHDLNKSIEFTYSGILKNLKIKPQKYNLDFCGKWIKLFKYKNDWVLFKDLPRFILSDSCLITFDMDDPTASIITDYDFDNNKCKINLLSYNWSNPDTNLNSSLEIKILNSEKEITLWKFSYQKLETYYFMIPEKQLNNFLIMIMKETDLMDDETDIFDKIDYEKLWNE